MVEVLEVKFCVSFSGYARALTHQTCGTHSLARSLAKTINYNRVQQ